MALLVLAPRHMVGREVLIERLFAHLPPDRGLRNVSKALSQARSVLGPDCLEADATNLWIAEHIVVESDLEAVSLLLGKGLDAPPPPELWPELRACLAGCGELLVDDVYEEWARPPIIALEDLARQARLALARASDETQDWLHVALHDAGCEEAWSALLSECAQRGDRVGLNQIFTRCRTAMLDELGIEPAPHIRELYASLRSELAKSDDTTTPTDLTVVGRDRELDMLQEIAQNAGEGRGGSILVAGAAGVGKSHLLTATAHRMSAQGYRLAGGACVPDDATVPFASLRSALAPMLSGPGLRGTLLGRLLDPASIVASPDRTMHSIARLADEISTALDALGDPVLVMLDDVHWADSALQALLVRLAAETRPRQWSLLMTARSDEPGHPLPPLPSRCHVVALPPLTREATATLARQLLSNHLALDKAAAEALVGVLVDRSAGNPFFLSELVRAAASGTDSPADVVGEEVPQRVVGLLRHRISTCSRAARDALAVVALAGEVATYDLLESALSLADRPDQDDRPPLDEAIAELRSGRLLTDSGGSPRMIHPLLRDAVVADLSAPARTDLHCRIAESLDTMSSLTGGSELSLWSATHRLAAFNASRSMDLAGTAAAAGLTAGGRALRTFATAPAAGLLESALAAYTAAPAADRDRLREMALRGWLDLGNSQLTLGEADNARTSYQQAIQIADTAVEKAHCIRSLAGLDYRAGRMTEAEAVLRQGLSTLAKKEQFARELLELEIAWTQHRREHFEEAQPSFERVAIFFEDSGDWVLAARSLDRLAMNLVALGLPAEALNALDRAEATNRGKDNHRQGILLIHRGSVLRDLGRLDEALRAVAAGASILEKSHDEYALSVGHWIAAQIHDSNGDLEPALMSSEAEIALLEEVGNNFNLARAMAHKASLLRRLGRDEDSDDAAAQARTAAAGTSDAALIARIEETLSAGNTAGTVAP